MEKNQPKDEKIVTAIAFIVTISFVLFLAISANRNFFEQAYELFVIRYVLNPTSLTVAQFSLGEAVAALGLIIAAFQLKSPTWDMVLRIKGKLKKNLIWILSVAALLIILIAALLEPIYGRMPIMLIIAYLLFAAAPLSVIVLGNKKNNIFKVETAERFYHVLLSSIATGDKNKMSAAIDVLLSNLDQILNTINEIDFFHSPEKDLPDIQKYAYGIIEITLSDTEVADYIVSERLDFLISFLQMISKKNMSQRAVGDGFRILTTRLYCNPNSYLFRQEKYSGTGMYAPINDMIFGSFHILNQFNPIHSWDCFNLDENILYNEKYVEVFLKSLETAIEKYGLNDTSVGSQVGYMLFKLNDYARDLVWKDVQPESFNKNKRILQKIESFYGSTFLDMYIAKWVSGDLSDAEKHPKKEERYRQSSLTSAYLDALVEFLGTIGNYDERNNLLRLMAMSATDKLLYTNENEAALTEIRKVFFEYSWDAIKQNIEQGYFPAFLRSYLSVIYLHNNEISPGSVITERNLVVSYINKNLKPKLKSGMLMNNDRDTYERILPNEIIYDKKRNKLYWVDASGSKSEFK